MSNIDYSQTLQQLQYYQQVYNNSGETPVDDDTFDALQSYYNTNNPSGIQYNPIGAKTDEGDVELPEKMPSLNKIKGENADMELDKFYNTYGDENIYQLKLDGVSLLVCYDNGNLTVYKRGDGDKGPQINHILPYVKFPSLNMNIHLRAEMMIPEETFEYLKPYIKSKGKNGENSRSVVNGALTKVNMDPYILQYCIPIFYEIKWLQGYEDKLTPLQELEYMSQLGLTVVPYSLMKIRMNRQVFDSYIEECRKITKYRMDGVVVVPNYIVPKSKVNRNPDHIFAYKKDSVAITEVINVEWNITSKDGYLNPVVHYRPVKLLGSTYSYFTGHNARFIVEKGIGPGAVISMRVNGDIIPGYDSTIVPSQNLSFPNCDYEWNENGVEIRLKNPDIYPQVKCMKIKYFLDQIGAKKWGLTTIMKLYNSAGVTNLSKLFYVTRDQLKTADLIDDKAADNLLSELHGAISSASMSKIMAGSGFFGEGISDNIMQKFIDEFPNWKFSSPSYDQILSRRDFGPVRAKSIVDGLEHFKNWLSQNPQLNKESYTSTMAVTSDKLAGQVINFSGFTDSVLVQQIKSMGGVFKDSHVKTVTLVVADNLNAAPSKKVEYALNNPHTVRLMDRNQFVQFMNQIRMGTI